jgi:hypothetical protein
MFQFLSSATHPATHIGSRTRLHLEPLEDRILLNNRFVVPVSLPVDNVTNFATLQDALTTNSAGLSSGDTIQIASGSTPGDITGAALSGLPAGLGRVTIQGDPAAPLFNIPQFTLDSPAILSAMDLTFQNVNIGLIGSGSFVFNNDSAIANSFIVNLSSTATNLITFAGTGDFLSNTKVLNQSPISGSELLVAPTAPSSNIISTNIFKATASCKLLVDYHPATYPTIVTDVIGSNEFVGDAGTNLYGLLSAVFADGLKVRDNNFSDPDPNVIAVSFQFVQNAQIVHNSVSLSGLGARGIEFFGSSASTSALIWNNTIANSPGPGLEIDVGTAPTATLNLQVQQNYFNSSQIGVLIDGATGFPGPVGGIDLGGGNQGSLGENSFDTFTTNATASSGAIVVTGVAASQGIIKAHKNSFSASINPRNVVSDPNFNLDLGLMPIKQLRGRVASSGQWWTGTSTGTSFTNQLWATWSPAVTWVDVQSGDFNGDGQSDIVGRVLETGQWWVGLSTGSSYETSLWTTWNPAVTWVDVQVGDFNGDGKQDLVGRVSQTGQIWVATSTGSSFTNSLWATWNPAATWVDTRVGDFSGDGKADFASRDLVSGTWWTAVSTGSSFNTSLWTFWSPSVTWVDVRVGDFTGDGKTDVAGRVLQSGQIWVGQSTGSSFMNALWTTWSPSVTWVDVLEGDFNGDGKDDLVGRVLQSGQWWMANSTGSSFANSLWATWNPAAMWVDVQVGDLNADGRADITGRDLRSGAWWTGLSNGSTGFTTTLWTIWNPAVDWVDVQNNPAQPNP